MLLNSHLCADTSPVDPEKDQPSKSVISDSQLAETLIGLQLHRTRMHGYVKAKAGTSTAEVLAWDGDKVEGTFILVGLYKGFSVLL